jgi:PAS domain S-box-containing protein
MKLTAKLLVIFASVSLIIVLVLGGIVYRRLWNERLSLIEEGISQQLQGFDFALKSFFAEVEGDVSALADNEWVRSREDAQFTSFLQADEKTFQYHYSELEQKIIQIFSAHRLTHPYISSIYMGRENGAFVRSHPRESPTRYDPRDRPWYVLAKANPGTVSKTDAYPSITTNDINIGVVKALVDENGAVYGVVGIDVTLVNLANYILDFKIRPAGKILLADQNGVILASQEQGPQGQPLEAYSPALRALLEKGGAGGDSLEIGGQRHYLFHQKSAVQNWSIAVLVPAAAIESDIRGDVLWTVFSLSAGLLLLSVLTLYGVHLFVNKPLGKLTQETDLITRTGDLERRIDIASRDEIGELASSYNEMVSALGQSQKSLQETEKAVRAAHQGLVNIIEFLPDATFVIDQDKRVVAWNRACEMMTGVKKDALLGCGDYAYAEPFFGERRPILIDLLDAPSSEVEAKYEYVKRVGDTIFAESYIPRLRGGQGAHLWGVAAPLFDQEGRRSGAIEVVRDVTEQRRMEQALRESEQKYRELVEHANSVILRWTHEGRITFLNEFGQRFFGYSAEEIVGRHIIGAIVPVTDSIGRDLRQLMDQIRADPIAFEQNVNENMRRNGERVWIAWTNRVVHDAQGQVSEILSVGTDITPLKRAEEAIRELNTSLERRVAERTAELAEARDRAQAADHLKSAFLATMSHELRTPLNSIIGFTGIILQGLAGPLNPEQRKQLEMVRDSARHLLALINDVLDISKIEAGQLTVSSELFDLRASVVKVVGIVRPLAEKKGLALQAETAPEIGALRSDPRRVEQILLNLLNNAIKFTERGTVALTVEIAPDALPAAPPVVRIAVADTGIGIKPEDLSKLFQPFRQIDTGLSRQHEGTGLGLAICRRLAELLGGKIYATSEWGKGSVFTVTLPLKG